jgi:hypothetical protein
VTDGADEAEGAVDALPEPMARVLGEYERHLVAERDLSRHSVRAYCTDVAGLLEHAARLGHVEVGTLDLRTLRSWLAKQQTLGRCRREPGISEGAPDAAAGAAGGRGRRADPGGRRARRRRQPRRSA